MTAAPKEIRLKPDAVSEVCNTVYRLARVAFVDGRSHFDET